MLETWITNIVLSVAFVYSKFYNTRRTEYPTYGLWNAVINRLVPFGDSRKLAGDVGDCVMVSPQYEVYLSPEDDKLDADNPRASIDTAPDSKRTSLFFDFAILVIVPAMRLNDSWTGSITSFLFDQLLQAPWLAPDGKVHRVLQAARIRISETHVLATVELKRPPPRMHKMKRWIRSLISLISAAQSQAFAQALYVLRSKRYSGSRKHGMFLIAGAGEWFTLRWVDLDSILTETFDLDDFNSMMETLKEQEKKLEAIEPALRTANPEASLSPTEAQVKKRKLDAARAARCVNRTLSSASRARKKRRAELQELMPPFIDEELEQWYQLDPDLELKRKENAMFLQQLPAGGLSGISLSILKDWTQPMRLGSPVGDAYLQFVHKRLIDVVEAIVPLPPLPRGPRNNL